MNRWMLACVVLLSTVGFAHADLLVIKSSGSSSSVLRFDQQTGQLLADLPFETEGLYGVATRDNGDLYVTSNVLGDGKVQRSSADGFLSEHFATTNLHRPGKLAFGPDGHLYIIASTLWSHNPARSYIVRYDGVTGAFLNYFVLPENGGTGSWTGLGFGPDGYLYVADFDLGILRFQADTGRYIGTFVAAGSAGLSEISGMIFGPDGNLYVSSRKLNAVLRFNGQTGVYLDTFVAPGSGGLDAPRGMAFGPDGRLYVSSYGTHSILRFDGGTGAYVDTFATHANLRQPTDLVFITSTRQ